MYYSSISSNSNSNTTTTSKLLELEVVRPVIRIDT